MRVIKTKMQQITLLKIISMSELADVNLLVNKKIVDYSHGLFVLPEMV